MNASEDTLILYLTDRQTPEEEDALERAALEDDEIFESLLLAETELVDAYVRGELENGGRRVVQDRMRKSSLFCERVEFASLLSEASEAGAGDEARYGFGIGWRVVGGMSCLFLAVCLPWLIWGSPEPGSSMPAFLLGMLVWIGLGGLVVSTFRWHAARERLRERLVGIEAVFAEPDNSAQKTTVT